MADKTYIGANGGVWETAGNWDPSGKPGSSDNVIFTTSVIPAAPVGAESIVNLTAAVTINLYILGEDGTLTITGVCTVPGSQSSVSGILWGPASTLHFTGANAGRLDSNDNETGPPTIISANDLFITCGFNSGSSHDLTGCSITSGGSVIIVPDVGNVGGVVNVTDAVIVGGGTPGSVYKAYGVTGTPASVSGVEPLYKEASGSTRSAYGASDIITVPDAATVASSADPYGDPDDPITGTLPGEGAGQFKVNTGPLIDIAAGEAAELPLPANVRANVPYGPASNRKIGTHPT